MFPTNHAYLSFVNIKHPSLSTSDEDAVLTSRCGTVIQGVGLRSEQDIQIYPIWVASWAPGLHGLHWLDVCWLAQPFRAQGNIVRYLHLEPTPSQDAGIRIQPQRYFATLQGVWWCLSRKQSPSFAVHTQSSLFTMKPKTIYTKSSPPRTCPRHFMMLFPSIISSFYLNQDI